MCTLDAGGNDGPTWTIASTSMHHFTRRQVNCAHGSNGSLIYIKNCSTAHCVFNASYRVCAYHSMPSTAGWSVHKSSIAWSTLDAEPLTFPPPMATPDQIWQCIEAAWSVVPQEHIQSLFESMPRRVTAVISNNGGYYGY
ncbi:hypothetical protein TNCV_2233821 [Trichonephila clavipes]|nr:hypothetical protein TNCV_2233821 [Trichonephila clavipes]